MRFQLAAGLTILPIALAATLVLFSPLPVHAQDKPAETDPRVQELYAEAKDAEAAGNPAEAIAKYEAILQIAPNLAPAYNNLGALYLRQREYDKAVAVLEKGLKINTKMSSASALLGVALYQTGDYAGARTRLETALHANPKDSNLELTLADDLVKLGQPEAAAAHYEGVARREPKNQEAWYQLGKVYMELSEKALVKLQEIDPNSVLVHEVDGEIMQSMNNYDGAIVEFKKAVEMAPQQAGTHYKLGDAYWSISQWDAAAKEFEAELANDPRSCLSHFKLGDIVLQQRGDPQSAMEELNKSIGMCPDLIDAREDRARALLRMDKYEDALPDLTAAAHANPSDPQAHYLLAQAYRSLGRAQDAQSEMQLFSKLEESARAATASRAQQVMQNRDQNQNPQQNPPQNPKQ